MIKKKLWEHKDVLFNRLLRNCTAIYIFNLDTELGMNISLDCLQELLNDNYPLNYDSNIKEFSTHDVERIYNHKFRFYYNKLYITREWNKATLQYNYNVLYDWEWEEEQKIIDSNKDIKELIESEINRVGSAG